MTTKSLSWMDFVPATSAIAGMLLFTLDYYIAMEKKIDDWSLRYP